MKSKIIQLFQRSNIISIINGILIIALILFVIYGSKPIFLEGMAEDTTFDAENADTSDNYDSTTSETSTSTPPPPPPPPPTSTSGSVYYDTNTYNHYNKANTVVFYAPDGTTAYLTTLSDGSKALVVNNNIYVSSSSVKNTYEYNGNTANITNINGEIVIKITGSDGVVTIYSPTQNKGITYDTTPTSTTTTTTSNKGTVTYTGPYGTTATLTTMGGITELAVTFRNNSSSIFYIDKNDTTGTIYIDSYGDKAVVNTVNNTIVVTTRHGETLTYTKVSGNVTSYSPYTPTYSSTPTYVSSSVTNQNTGNTVGSVTGPNDNTLYYSNVNSGTVNGKPITVSSIPPGDEDLYILKSQVVPPVCPVCPPQIVKKCEKEKECGPCPIQRCPTAPFKCVKQPDYSNPEIKQYLPIPVLNSFSTFGL
jgi:hypothetical protein